MASADVWRALPKTLWPTSAGGTPERSSACFAATAPSSIAERSFSVPPKVPKPVRTPERNTTSVLEPWVFIGGKLHVRRGEYRGDRGRAVGRVAVHGSVASEQPAQVGGDAHEQLVRRPGGHAPHTSRIDHRPFRQPDRERSKHSREA